MVSSGDGWFRGIADVFAWIVSDGCEKFWVLGYDFGWFQVVFSNLQF